MMVEDINSVLEFCDLKGWQYLGFEKQDEKVYFWAKTDEDVRRFEFKDGKPAGIYIVESIQEHKAPLSSSLLKEIIDLSQWYSDIDKEKEDRIKSYIGEFTEIYLPEKPDRSLIKKILQELYEGQRVLRRVLKSTIPLNLKKKAAELLFELQFIEDKKLEEDALPLLIDYRNKAKLMIDMFTKLLSELNNA